MKLSYITLGTDDLPAATRFYAALFEHALTAIGATERMQYFQGQGFVLALALPFDGQPAQAGNGVMIGFDLGSEAAVAQMHARALTLGGTSEGSPGPRGPRYSAYARDPSGNKLCFFA